MKTMKVHPSYATGIYLTTSHEDIIPLQIEATHSHNDKPLGVFNIFEVSYGDNIYGDNVPFYVMYKNANSDEVIRLELQYFIRDILNGIYDLDDEVNSIAKICEGDEVDTIDYIYNNVTNNQWSRISGLIHANKFTVDMEKRIANMISQNLNNNSLEQYICRIWIGVE